MTRVREYCAEIESEGKDEGGYYKMVEAPDVPAKLRRQREHRIGRCSGCHDNFYNHRMNCTGQAVCWNLDDPLNFQCRGGKPKCWH